MWLESSSVKYVVIFQHGIFTLSQVSGWSRFNKQTNKVYLNYCWLIIAFSPVLCLWHVQQALMDWTMVLEQGTISPSADDKQKIASLGKPIKWRHTTANWLRGAAEHCAQVHAANRSAGGSDQRRRGGPPGHRHSTPSDGDEVTEAVDQ